MTGMASNRTATADAVSWAIRQLGQRTHRGYCQRFIEHAYGSDCRVSSAWRNAHDFGYRPGPPHTIPRGALVFFCPHETNDWQGHVGISLGGGRMVSAVDRVRIDDVRDGYWRSLYLGWRRPRPVPPVQVKGLDRRLDAAP